MTTRAGTRRVSLVVATLVAVTISATSCTFVRQASRDANGNDGTAASVAPMLDSDGGYMTFQSDATNLVDGDTNGKTDVFKIDVASGHLERPSVATDGTQANGASRNPDIDCCGGLITFESDATNLVPGDTNGTTDIFVHSQITRATTLVSVASGGGPTNGPSTHPVISADGEWVVFESTATNIVPGVSGHQIYARHWKTNDPTVLVSAASCNNGTYTAGNGVSTGPRVGGDDSVVAFTSTSTNFSTNPQNSSPNAYVAPLGVCGSTSVPTLAGYDASNHVLTHGSVVTSVDRQIVAYDGYGSTCPGTCSLSGVYVRNTGTSTTQRVRATDALAAGGWLNQGGNTIAMQITGPGGIGPVAAVIELSTGIAKVISTDALGNPRAIQPVVDPLADTPRMNRYSVDFAYAAPVTSGGPPQVFAQAMQLPPTVSGVSPNAVTRGATNALLTITGSGFVSSSGLVPPTGFTVDSTTFVDSSTLRVVVDIASDAPTGAQNVLVTAPGRLVAAIGSIGLCAGCLTVN